MYGRTAGLISRQARVLLFPQCRTLSTVRYQISFPEKVADSMIRAASMKPKGWHGNDQPTLTLMSDIQEKQLSRAPSLEKIAFSGAEGWAGLEDDSNQPEYTLEPGTFVELRRSNVTTSAVVLTDCVLRGARKLLSLTSSGEVWDHDVEDALFSLPAFTPSDLVARCGVDIDPATNVQRHARVEVLRRIREVNRSVAHSLNHLHAWDQDIYENFKSANPEKWSKVSLPELARMWEKRPTPVHLLACHKYLMERPLHFVAPHDYSTSQQFEVRPQAEVDLITTVTHWSRTPGSALAKFIKKARPIVAANEKAITDSFGKVEDPTWIPASHNWDKNDLLILKFLVNSLRPVRPSQTDPYEIPQTKLVRAILPNIAEHDDSWTHKLLMWLGVLAPWHDLITSRADMRFYTLEKTLENEAIAAKSFQFTGPAPLPSQPLGPLDLYRSDPLESVRRDFGQLPVYVIDDPTALELDDGVSIETIPTEPNRYWLHVHVADPCSILPPTHLLAQEAIKRSETMYLLDRAVPLLPDSLTMGQTGASLRETDEPQRVMTFSSKVDADGGLFESTVHAGLVRRIIKTTYNSVDSALGFPAVQKTYPFGDSAPASQPVHSLNETSVQDLRLIQAVGQGFIRKRLREGAFTIARESANLENFTVPTQFPNPSFAPGVFRGFPGNARLAVSTTAELDVGAFSIVAEAMKLGCWTASRFCAERNIPMIRRTALPPVMISDSAWQDVLHLRSATGYISQQKALPYIASGSAANYSVEPKAHFALSIPEGEGYTRVTSPLRRAGDLIAHWQLHSALLGKKPVFSADWLTRYSRAAKARDKLRSRTRGHYETFFNMSFIQRFLEDPKRREGKPNPFLDLEGYIYRPATLGVQTKLYQGIVTIPKLGIRAVLNTVKDPGLIVGEQIALELESIRTGLIPHMAVKIRE